MSRLSDWLKPRPKPQPQTIYAELVAEIGAPPTRASGRFEQYPFEWPGDTPDASVPEVLPSDVDDELIALDDPEQWPTPPSDTDLLKFWDAIKRGV